MNSKVERDGAHGMLTKSESGPGKNFSHVYPNFASGLPGLPGLYPEIKAGRVESQEVAEHSFDIQTTFDFNSIIFSSTYEYSQRQAKIRECQSILVNVSTIRSYWDRGAWMNDAGTLTDGE